SGRASAGGSAGPVIRSTGGKSLMDRLGRRRARTRQGRWGAKTAVVLAAVMTVGMVAASLTASADTIGVSGIDVSAGSVDLGDVCANTATGSANPVIVQL